MPELKIISPLVLFIVFGFLDMLSEQTDLSWASHPQALSQPWRLRWKPGSVLTGAVDGLWGTIGLPELCPAFQKTRCHIIFHPRARAHAILDPASSFEAPFPIVKSFLTHLEHLIGVLIASSHRTVLSASVPNGFSHEGLATQVGAYCAFHFLQNIWLFSAAKSPST